MNELGYLIVGDYEGDITVLKKLGLVKDGLARQEFENCILESISSGPDDVYSISLVNLDSELDDEIEIGIKDFKCLNEGDEVYNYSLIELLSKDSELVEYNECPYEYAQQLEDEGYSAGIKKFTYKKVADILDIEIDQVKKHFDLDSWNEYWEELYSEDE